MRKCSITLRKLKMNFSESWPLHTTANPQQIVPECRASLLHRNHITQTQLTRAGLTQMRVSPCSVHTVYEHMSSAAAGVDEWIRVRKGTPTKEDYIICLDTSALCSSAWVKRDNHIVWVIGLCVCVCVRGLCCLLMFFSLKYALKEHILNGGINANLQK